MPIFRVLCHYALAMALMVDGLVSGGMVMTSVQAEPATAIAAASGDSKASKADEHGACHEDATATSDTQPDNPVGAPMDCCDGGGCACSCLQHAPAVFMVIVVPDAMRFDLIPHLGLLASLPSAPIAPQFRPPIA